MQAEIAGMDLALAEVYKLIDNLLERYPNEVFETLDPNDAYYYRGYASALDDVIEAIQLRHTTTINEYSKALEKQYGGHNGTHSNR